MSASMPRRVRVERGIYRNPSTGRLEIQYTDETGRCRWRTIEGGLRQARIARANAQRERINFAAVAEEWIRTQTRLRERTYTGYATALDRHLIPRLGDRPITEIDEDTIANLIADLEAQGLAGWTIKGILVPLGRVLNYAARRKLIPYNPIHRLERSERPRVARREMRILDVDEIAALLEATPPTYRPLIATAVFAGLRQSELLGLRWADVDFENGLINVRRQLDRSGRHTEPKTPRSSRTVLLTPSLAALLEEHKRQSAFSDPGDPVFATATGAPMYYRNVTRRGLAVAIEAAHLNHEFAAPLRFHDLRHTYSSLLIANNLNVVFLSRQLGHVYPSFTLDTYGGLFDRAENGRRAIRGLEAAFPGSLRDGARNAPA